MRTHPHFLDLTLGRTLASWVFGRCFGSGFRDAAFSAALVRTAIETKSDNAEIQGL